MKKLSEIGERKAIQIISSFLSSNDKSVGVGDDCAAIDFEGKYLLISTDMINEKTHIPIDMTPWQMGWFIVAINLSDIAAKGGIPIGVVVSLGLPSNKSKRFLRQLTKGMNRCARKFDSYIYGGDTKQSSEINLCGTAFGHIEKDKFMSRKGINKGDILAVTNYIGGATAGYYSLKNNLNEKKVEKLLLEPVPRLREGKYLSEEKIVTSCIDISDGISSSLYQLKEINKIGFEINKKSIPYSPHLKKINEKINLDLYNKALYFGGDYELLLTTPYDKFNDLKDRLERKNIFLTPIGKAKQDDKITITDEKNNIKILPNKGYEHFIRQ
ncbi:MAG: thiamine-phosphate kinase [Candidatus Thermoplasmatota archaeon]